MFVFKFGGASLKDADHINNVVSIIEKYKHDDIVVVASAMGKTTNYLETVWTTFLEDGNWLEQLMELKNQQTELVLSLFKKKASDVLNGLEVFYDSLISFLKANKIHNENYLYDQIISLGELTSSFILSMKLSYSSIENKYIYAKELIRTDFTFREGKVNWEKTKEQITGKISSGISVTQGFIGGTENEQNITLGREGSDYSAAIFAYCLNAESVTVWKDVDGVLNADPNLIADTEQIKQLSYKQAILLTHYGAKVIHPKTIAPLKEKGIKLFVRSYNNLDNEGTCISNIQEVLPPVFIQNIEQIIISFSSVNGSLHPQNLSDILFLFKEIQLPPYFIDYSPIELIVSTNNQAFKLEKLRKNLPDSLTINSENSIEMGVYHGNLESAPTMKQVDFFHENEVFRIALGKF